METTMKFDVSMSLLASQKMKYWIELAAGEVSGLGLIREIKNAAGLLTGIFVEDIYLIKQVSGGADTDLNDDGIVDLQIALEQQCVDSGRLKLWWHSHGGGGTFWSSKDEDTIKGFGYNSYALSIVSNKKNDVLCRLDMYKPIRASFNKIDVDIVLPEFDMQEECKKEFEEKVDENYVKVYDMTKRGYYVGGMGGYMGAEWYRGAGVKTTGKNTNATALLNVDADMFAQANVEIDKITDLYWDICIAEQDPQGFLDAAEAVIYGGEDAGEKVIDLSEVRGFEDTPVIECPLYPHGCIGCAEECALKESGVEMYDNG